MRVKKLLNFEISMLKIGWIFPYIPKYSLFSLPKFCSLKEVYFENCNFPTSSYIYMLISLLKQPFQATIHGDIDKINW
jgi:hypothetical protein